jgi:hypothetical protein
VAILKIPHWYTFPTDEGAKLVKLLHINGLAFSEQPCQKVNVLVLKWKLCHFIWQAFKFAHGVSFAYTKRSSESRF